MLCTNLVGPTEDMIASGSRAADECERAGCRVSAGANLARWATGTVEWVVSLDPRAADSAEGVSNRAHHFPSEPRFPNKSTLCSEKKIGFFLVSILKISKISSLHSFTHFF